MAKRGMMTVREAGRRGGKLGGRRGGTATMQRYGRNFYERIGKRGGARVRRLVAQGKQALGEPKVNPGKLPLNREKRVCRSVTEE